MSKNTFVDIFAGCGGLSLGLMQAGWQGIFAVEHDKNAFETLKSNLINEKSGKQKFSWPNWLSQTPHDATTFVATHREKLKAFTNNIDMVVGGPPCQGFSTAGRRDPNDPRNKLVDAYLEFVEIINPKIVLLENVRGITMDFDDGDLTGKKVNYAGVIIKTLSGKYTVSSKLVNTSDFGVPQRRQRFFIIAIRKDIATRFPGNPFDLIENNRRDFIMSKKIVTVPVSVKMAISDLELEINEKIPNLDNENFNDISHKKPLTVYQQLMNEGHKGRLSDTRLANHKPNIAQRFSEIIDICKESGRLNVSLSKAVKDKYKLKKCAIRVLDPDSPSPTITSMPDDLIHYSEPRTLTVRENARIQSFPDWFSFHGKYTSGGDRRRKEVPRFTQVANAVPPLIAEAFGETLRKVYFNCPPIVVASETVTTLQTFLDSPVIVHEGLSSVQQ